MKKIILILLIILTSLSFSKNLDNYESKRVFDKIIDCLVNSNYEKYKNDKEMRRYYKDIEGNLDSKYFNEYSRNFIKDNKYEVISINELDNESILKVNVIYSSYKNISPFEYGELYENVVLELESIRDELTGIEYLNKLSDKIYNKMKSRIVVENKIITVYMDKKKNLWDIQDRDENSEFLDIYLSYLGFESEVN